MCNTGSERYPKTSSDKGSQMMDTTAGGGDEDSDGGKKEKKEIIEKSTLDSKED